MSAVVLRLRAEVRQRWAPWLGVALVAGLASAGSSASWPARCAPAVPTGTSAARCAPPTPSSPGGPFGLGRRRRPRRRRRLPQVRDTARASVSLVFTGRTDDGRRVGPVDLFPVLPADEPVGHTDRALDIAWACRRTPTRSTRRPRASCCAEHSTSSPAAPSGSASSARRGFRPPRSSSEQLRRPPRGRPRRISNAIDELADGPDVDVPHRGHRGVAVGVPPGGPRLTPPLHLTRAFTERYGSHVVSSPLLFVRLRDAGQLDAFSKGIERLANGQPAGFVQSRPLQTPKVERAIRVQATAVRLVALLALVAVLLVVGQALLRQAFAEAGDDRVLPRWAWSATSSGCWCSRADLVIGIASAVLAVVVAVLMSPLMPVGSRASPTCTSGFDVDPLLLGLGAIAVLVGSSRCEPWPRGGCGGRVGDPVRRATALSRRRLLERSRLSPSADIGVRFALDPGRGETSTRALDDRPRGHAHHRAPGRPVVVPEQPPAHARLTAALRLELERQERHAGVARHLHHAGAGVLARSRRLGLRRRDDHAGRARARAGRRDGHAAGTGAGGADRGRRSAPAARQRGDARRTQPRAGRSAARRHRGAPARQHRGRAAHRRPRALPRVR